MLVKPQDPAASSDRPGRLRIVGEVTGIGVHEFFGTRASRFWRSLLNQDRRQQDEHRHLQEFAFPVLEQGLPGVAGAEIAVRG